MRPQIAPGDTLRPPSARRQTQTQRWMQRHAKGYPQQILRHTSPLQGLHTAQEFPQRCHSNAMVRSATTTAAKKNHKAKALLIPVFLSLTSARWSNSLLHWTTLMKYSNFMLMSTAQIMVTLPCAIHNDDDSGDSGSSSCN